MSELHPPDCPCATTATSPTPRHTHTWCRRAVPALSAPGAAASTLAIYVEHRNRTAAAISSCPRPPQPSASKTEPVPPHRLTRAPPHPPLVSSCPPWSSTSSNRDRTAAAISSPLAISSRATETPPLPPSTDACRSTTRAACC
jgi:hypothetical protein